MAMRVACAGLGCCTLLVIAGHLALSRAGQAPSEGPAEAPLDREIGRLRLGRDQLGSALARTLRVARVPGGLAAVVGCGPDPYPSYDFGTMGPALSDALGSIRKVAPAYEWRADQGVVDVFPKSGVPAFLLTRVNEFDSKDAVALTYAADLLLQLPEVRLAKARLGFADAPNEVDLGMYSLRRKDGTPAPTLLRVTCRDCSVFEVLNKMVKKRGSGVWVFYEYRCHGSKTFRLSFSD